MILTKAIEINAVVKALNLVTANEERRLQVVAHLMTLNELHHWRFGLRDGRIVADARPVVPSRDHRELLQELLNKAGLDDEPALLRAAQYLQGMPWYTGAWDPEVHEGLLMLRETT